MPGLPARSFPLPEERLREIVNAVCEQSLQSSTYESEGVKTWNAAIIDRVIRNLVSETPQGKYKFVVQSTIMQHDSQGHRRGMHNATGAYWDASEDGTWTTKVDGLDSHDFDVLVTISWTSNTGH